MQKEYRSIKKRENLIVASDIKVMLLIRFLERSL